MLLENKVAIVTGAGSGIGAASALRFAAEGAAVLAADIRGHKADQTVAEITARGGVAHTCEVNVAEDDAVADSSGLKDLIVARRRVHWTVLRVKSRLEETEKKGEPM